ncbi:MAG: hypothetical protein AAF213_14015, partial [Pseudomonadota bacterium]
MTYQPRNLHKRAAHSGELAARAHQQRQLAIGSGPALSRYTHRLFARFGVEITDVNIKGKRRLSEKAAKDYGGIVDMVGDTVRLKVICDTADQVAKVQHQLWRQKEMQISRHGRGHETNTMPSEPTILGLKDNFADPKIHGYRALNAKIRMPNGVIAEVQVVHRGMEAMSKRTHGGYQQLSDLLREVGGDDFTPEQARQYQKLVTRLNKAYGAVAAEHGLDRLMTMTARAEMMERRHWLKRLVARADVQHAEEVGIAVSEETQTLASLPLGKERPRLRSDGKTSSQKTLDARIDWAVSTRQVIRD